MMSGIDRSITPLNKKTIDGSTERDKALNRVFLLKQTLQTEQYAAISMQFIIRYIAIALSKFGKKYVFGILKIIKIKQPYRPICSVASTYVLCYLS